jgi:hypothetical protein
MIAAFATLAFLTALWLVAVAAALTLLGSQSKIVAALRGQSQLAEARTATSVVMRISPRARSERPLRAQPAWRAAA